MYSSGCLTPQNAVPSGRLNIPREQPVDFILDGVPFPCIARFTGRDGSTFESRLETHGDFTIGIPVVEILFIPISASHDLVEKDEMRKTESSPKYFKSDPPKVCDVTPDSVFRITFSD